MRRLTKAQYANTVKDLLGVTVSLEDLSDDTVTAGFQAGGPVSTNDAARLRDTAETVAREAVKNLAGLVPCNPTAGDETCARAFINRFGKRAFRRPLEKAEEDGLVAYFTKARADAKGDFGSAIRMVVQLVLQMPDFLYRWERSPSEPAPAGAAPTRLGPWELASRLSYLLWNTMPDDALFDAAAGGKLANDAEVARQAERLLADPRAREALGSFFRQWVLHSDGGDAPGKDGKAYPEYSVALWRTMEQELSAFGAHVVLEAGAGGLRTLLTAPYSFVNADLAKVYGATGVTGAQLGRADLNADQRAGLLTSAAFLTHHATASGSHPVKRGAWVYESLLCGEMPPVPDEVPPVKPAAADVSTRERFADHATNPCAKACHGILDPIGFGLEHYDAIGRYREMDGGKAVDATGQVTFPSGAPARTFNGARQLAAALADSTDVRTCLSRQFVRLALGRLEGPEDSQTLDALKGTLESGKDDLRALLVALTRSPSFLHRSEATR